MVAGIMQCGVYEAQLTAFNKEHETSFCCSFSVAIRLMVNIHEKHKVYGVPGCYAWPNCNVARIEEVVRISTD